MLEFWFAGFLVVVVLFYDADVVAAVSVVLSSVAAVVVSASAVVLFFVAPVVPALAGSFHFLVAGFAVAVHLAVAVHHLTTSLSLEQTVRKHLLLLRSM